MSNTVQESVARGVQWLNEQLGPDWPDFIDRDELAMWSPSSCVLGQLLGGYWAALDGLGYGRVWAEDHGFTSNHYDGYTSLTREWNEYLDGYEYLQEQSA